MCKKLIYLTSFVLVLAVTGTALADALDDAVAHWGMVDGTDLNGPIYTNVGEINPVNISGEPITAPNFNGWAHQGVARLWMLDFPPPYELVLTGPVSVFVRVKMSTINSSGITLIWSLPGDCNDEDSYWIWLVDGMPTFGVIEDDGTGTSTTRTEVSVGQAIQTNIWYDMTGVFDPDNDLISITVSSPVTNEVLEAAYASVAFDNIQPTATSGDRNLGEISWFGFPCNRIASGTDSDLCERTAVWDRALDIFEIAELSGAALTQSSGPNPDDGETDVLRDDVVLSWTSGHYAQSHDVYFGTVFDNVNDADRTNPLGALVSQDQTPNTYVLDRLDFGQTYYWRVDEVNAPPEATIFKGDVWGFTVEPIAYPIAAERITVTASSSGVDQGAENTINGSGLDANDLHSIKETDMWLSDAAGPQPTWIQYEFDKVCKLHEMWVWNHNGMLEQMMGIGFKDVSIEYSVNGTDYTTLGTTHEFAQGTGAADYEHNTTVDFGGVPAKFVRLTANSNWVGFLVQYGLSEVRFFSTPVFAREPGPDSGATDVDVDVTFGFRAGREAAKHDVYLSTDEQAVIDGTAPVTTVTETSYSTSVDIASTYYWRVDEVNDAETPTTWQGDIWSLSTPEFLVVDDFELYNDLDPGDPESNRIFNTWIDGYGTTTNGSLVGYDVAPFAEQSIVHGGNQSMPLSYDNSTAGYSEATANVANLQVGQDWTKHGVTTLLIYFHGDPSNDVQQMYVKVNDAKVLYDGDAADIIKPQWKQWSIDLASLGISLSNITTLSIGVDGGGSGMLYVDDIALYKSAPAVASEEIWIEAEAADTIIEPMQIRSDVAGGSGGQYISVEEDIDSPDAPTDGIATYTFTVAGGTYEIDCRVIVYSGSDDAYFVTIPGATVNRAVHDSGWVYWNGVEVGEDWHWDIVHSRDDDDLEVEWTLEAGTHTLQIAYRNGGPLLDAIVIRKID